MSQAYRNYVFGLEPTNKAPVAVILPAEQQAVVGSIIKLDGTASFDPEGNPLVFTWSFTKVPIGSQVEKTGFTKLESDSSIISFSPDITGPYEVQLVVSDGTIDSDPALAQVDVRVILVPHNEGYIPDASFIWNYLSDFWTRVEGRARFETLWSAAIQLIASELLKLYQYDYNKSIQDIQDLFQRRWLSYPIELVLDRSKVSFILADDQAGSSASSVVLDDQTGMPLTVQPDIVSNVIIPTSEGSFSSAAYGGAISTGRVLQFGGRSFTLLRSNSPFKSENFGTTGVQIAATNRFQGGLFSAGMVGHTLRVFSGGKYTDYKISVFTSQVEVQVTTMTGGAVVFAAATGLTYTVLPPVALHSSFMSDRPRVPGKLSGKFWRFSSTLISSEFDFEEQGVSPGDVLVAEVRRQDTNVSATFNVQVVSVDRNRLGFVFNIEELSNGIAAGGLSDEDQVTLAASLRVAGLTTDVNGMLAYSDQAGLIKTTTASPLFKRTNFETELTPDRAVNVGPFSVYFRPVSIMRVSKVPVDAQTVSIPVLQEYIKQPQLVTQNGQLFQMSEEKLFPLSRNPYLLIENLDYIVDDESTLRGVCSLTAGVDLISIPFGDLLDRGVAEGDSLVVTIGSLEELFTIKHLVDDQTVQVFPVPTLSSTGAQYRMSRRVSGKYVRFVNKIIDKKNIIPKRLWAEVIYFDNSPSVEANFGVLVGITKEQLDKQSAQVPYKSAVAGLMYALATGPTVSNLGLAAHILLGLPFTQNAGTITEINPSYRVRDDGSPLLGRILVEGVDKKGNPLGLTNIYFYPQGRQLPDPANPGGWIPANPDLSGLETNLETGLPYAVGDTVSQFAPLAKGAKILDYITSPDWFQKFVRQGDNGANLTKYHAFELLVNSDIVGPADIDLVAQFIQKAKPTYIKLITAFQKAVEDQVVIEDGFLLTKPYKFFEHTSLGMATAVKFDYPAKAADDFVSVEGQMYALYLWGNDLQTTQGSTTVTSASGGFINPSAVASHDTPFIRPGDLVVIYGGNNAGRYVVGTVGADTNLNGLTRLDGAVFTFQTLANQEFAVYRPLGAVVYKVAGVVVTQGNPVIPVGDGLFSAGVSPGDVLTFSGGGVFSRQYVVAEVDTVNEEVTLTTAPVEVTGARDLVFVRPGLRTRYLLERVATSFPFLVDLTIGSRLFQFQAAALEEALFMDPGDLLVRQSTGEVFPVVDFDPATQIAITSAPAPANAVGEAFQIQKAGRATTPISSDILDRVPGESVFLTLLSSGQDLTTSNGSADVTTVSGQDFFDLGLAIGDYLVVREGADSTVDIGYGPGIYPIINISGVGNVTLTLARTLTETHNAPGILYGLQRRKVL